MIGISFFGIWPSHNNGVGRYFYDFDYRIHWVGEWYGLVIGDLMFSSSRVQR